MFSCFFSQVFLDLSRFLGFKPLSWLMIGWAESKLTYPVKILGFKVALLRSETFFWGLVGASKSLIYFLRGLALVGLSPKVLSIFSSQVIAFCNILPLTIFFSGLYPLPKTLSGEIWEFSCSARRLCFLREPIFLRGEFSFWGDFEGLVNEAAFLNGDPLVDDFWTTSAVEILSWL